MSNLPFREQTCQELDEDEIIVALVEYVSRRQERLCMCGEYVPHVYWEIHRAEVVLTHVPECPYYMRNALVTPDPPPNPIDEAIEKERESRQVPVIDKRDLAIEELRMELAKIAAKFMELDGGPR